MTLLYVCNPCTLPQKELADSFLFLLNFAYDTVKVGECTKGHAKKGEKRKKLQKFYRRPVAVRVANVVADHDSPQTQSRYI